MYQTSNLLSINRWNGDKIYTTNTKIHNLCLSVFVQALHCVNVYSIQRLWSNFSVTCGRILSFDFQRTWWWLYQTRAVHTKIHIYVVILPWLTLHSTVFKLYRGSQFYWRRKPEYSVKTEILMNCFQFYILYYQNFKSHTDLFCFC
jgi:hypothetical protein